MQEANANEELAARPTGILGPIAHALRLALCVPLLLPFVVSTNRHVIAADCRRWAQVQKLNSEGFHLLWRLLLNPVFRGLYYHRLKTGGTLSYAVSRLLKLFYKPLPTLVIYTADIGPGFYIEHGFATVIAARRIGADCWVNQQVTIGFADSEAPATEAPVLCDGVRVHCGAKVLGGVTIGDNVRIGANAVVMKSVPPECTVVGVPARIVRRQGKRVDEAL